MDDGDGMPLNRATKKLLRQSSTVVNSDYYYYNDDSGPMRLQRDVDRAGTSVIGSVVEMGNPRSGLASSDDSNDLTLFSDGDDVALGESRDHEDLPFLSSVDLTATRRDRRGGDRRRPKNPDGGKPRKSQRQEQGQEQHEHMVESVVNFSCHTPNAVLEDLIRHELDLCGAADGEPKLCEINLTQRADRPRGEMEEPGSCSDDDSDDESSVSSLSSDGRDDRRRNRNASFDGSQASLMADVTDLLLLSSDRGAKISTLPKSRERESCLLFVDITGFTKLSTLLDVESLSRVINSYFDMIIDEVTIHGGDVLKFAGDALFIEWRVQGDDDQGDSDGKACLADEHGTQGWVLRQLNASLTSVHQSSDTLQGSRQLPSAVLRASRCAASIVEKFCDHEVSTPSNASSFASDANPAGPGSVGVLNVHCGIGSGRLIGFHVGDCQEGNSGLDGDGQEDNNVELRREYLFLGDAIEQASRAAHAATDGEVLVSPEALLSLSTCCDVPDEMLAGSGPRRIASRGATFLNLSPRESTTIPKFSQRDDVGTVPVQENLRKHCRRLNRLSLSRLHMQTALYVHPVVRGDILSTVNISKPTILSDGAMKQGHHTEAELRNVYTMFVKAMVDPNLSGDPRIDRFLFMTLRDVMQLTSRELDRYSGQLRQFIVDDKGVVLIAVFGLRGSTFPNLVANNALPASFAIHKALQGRGIDCRIGATFGKVYCGVVGGVRRHEYSVMGAPVNLAARLMECRNNKGILVDENVRNQAIGRFAFRSLQPIEAKGYDRPVAVLEPVHAIQVRSVRTSAFIGRQSEKGVLLGIANEILDNPFKPQASVVTLIGETSIGKSALGNSVMNEIKAICLRRKRHLVSLRSISTEDQQRIPLSAFRKVVLGAIRELCLQDETFAIHGDAANMTGEEKEGLELVFSPPLTRHMSDRNMFSMSPQKGIRSRDLQYDSPRRESMIAIHRPTSFGPKRATSHQVMPHADMPTPHTDHRHFRFPYLEKLRLACVESGFHEQYADYIGSQFLALRNSRPITHVNGRVPGMNDVVECVTQAFIRIVDFADITNIFIDDFQWADSVTLKVIRALGQSGKKMLLMCASRSHDKQAMRRMATELPFRLEITLGPLALPDIRALIASILEVQKNVTIDEETCTEIYQKSGGLPVYIIELLESVKRKKAYSIDNDGKLILVLNGGPSKSGEENNATILKESLLNRFDTLDSPVRKVLHTCAVLGSTFSLSELARIHPEIDVYSLEDSMSVALSEMILVEILDDDEKSAYSNSTGGSTSKLGSSGAFSKTASGMHTHVDRHFEFSHDMWRTTVLATMLKGRKTELHRLIAAAMEKDQVKILKRSDLARLLTLFEHWKACGEFLKAAPLAMTVGTRLNEWDLLHQSIDLYRDALDMSLGQVQPVDNTWQPDHDDWVQVSSTPEVLYLIIRLHIRIAENHRKLEDMEQCIRTYQDAYTILSSSSGSSCAMMIAVLAGLCDANLGEDPNNDHLALEQESLIKQFVAVAMEEGNPVHLARALAMEACYFAQRGEFDNALEVQLRLVAVYRAEDHSRRLVKRYHKDYALETVSQSIFWYFLVGKQEEATKQAVFVIQNHLPLQDPRDVDSIMALILPAILILKFVGRGRDALYILGRYVVNAHHDYAPCETYWVELFNPLVYLLEIIKMEECDVYKIDLMDAIQSWVLNEANSYYSPEHLRLGHTVMGEICFRLGHLKQVDDPLRAPLMQRARFLLTPIARDIHSEPFLAHSALAFLRAIG